MADYLDTLAHLATWTRKDPAVVEVDPLAQMVMERVTEMVVSRAAIDPTWPTDSTLVPPRARTIALLVAARTYTNIRSIISSGVGPVSETMMAQMAAAMQFTEAEAEELDAMASAVAGTFGGLYVITTTTQDGTVPVIDNIALPDNLDPDWPIPYLRPGETGALDPEVP